MIFALIFALIFDLISLASSALHIGVGLHDVTGPVGGVNFMGYAMPEQITQGVHMRLRSRGAFIH